ncbi:hypothetical protein FNF27_00526 [Cafeteria roenbergensis]|uniref:Uncharacterized protein n=1 Tax=Cafeteria roenbergensis TaxID=33653 RepID=A0A5A8ELK6_CAFRO|nr:hypothetical protein FNF27_00526 [Cafeteria roenbergensis]
MAAAVVPRDAAEKLLRLRLDPFSDLTLECAMVSTASSPSAVSAACGPGPGECALLRAETIASLDVLRFAAARAVYMTKAGRSRAKSLQSELMTSVSPVSSFHEAVRRFGPRAGFEGPLLAARIVSAEGAPRNPILPSSASADVWLAGLAAACGGGGLVGGSEISDRLASLASTAEGARAVAAAFKLGTAKSGGPAVAPSSPSELAEACICVIGTTE